MKGFPPYDPTAGRILTPGGVGKFVAWDPARKTVLVEMDYFYLVEYPGDRCYILPEEVSKMTSPKAGLREAMRKAVAKSKPLHPGIVARVLFGEADKEERELLARTLAVVLRVTRENELEEKLTFAVTDVARRLDEEPVAIAIAACLMALDLGVDALMREAAAEESGEGGERT